MKIASRRVVLAAAVALPLAAAVASFALAEDAAPPDVPAPVRVGESANPSTATPVPSTTTPKATPSREESEPPTPRRTTQVVSPPPVIDDDDDGGDDDGGSDDSGDDDDDD